MTIHKTHPCHGGNYQAGRAGPIKYLVIHYVGALGGAEANARYYGTTPGIGASAHYFVGHGPAAEVWASVAEGDTAWHCGTTKGYRHPECRNANSIGIEMCCWKDQAGRWYFDDATVDRTVELARDIMARHGIDGDHVVRHYEVTGKRCPAPYVDDPAAWEAFKKRLEGKEMTREEVQALVESVKPKVYTDLSQVPKWARETVKRAMATPSRDDPAGVMLIQGDGTGKLRLTDQDLTDLERMRKAGLLKGGAV